jgi:hypothetical protein
MVAPTRPHYLTRRIPRVTPMLSRIVTERDDARSLQKITDKASLVKCDAKNVGATHIGKRK